MKTLWNVLHFLALACEFLSKVGFVCFFCLWENGAACNWTGVVQELFHKIFYGLKIYFLDFQNINFVYKVNILRTFEGWIYVFMGFSKILILCMRLIFLKNLLQAVFLGFHKILIFCIKLIFLNNFVGWKNMFFRIFKNINFVYPVKICK